MDERDRLISQLLQRVSDLEAAFSRIPARFAAETKSPNGIYLATLTASLAGLGTSTATINGSEREIGVDAGILIASGQTVADDSQVYVAKVVNSHTDGKYTFMGAACDSVSE